MGQLAAEIPLNWNNERDGKYGDAQRSSIIRLARGEEGGSAVRGYACPHPAVPLHRGFAAEPQPRVNPTEYCGYDSPGRPAVNHNSHRRF